MTTFPRLLARLLADNPGRPLVTFYDDATGERTELSVSTWATWVAKVSSLLADDLELERGDRILVDLPAHWLGPIVLGAAWSCGLEVVWPSPSDGTGDSSDGTGDGTGDRGAPAVQAVVTGPEGLARWAASASTVPVLASALHPLGVPFADGVPPGVHDLGVEVWSHPDRYDAFPPPEDDDPAVPGQTQAELWTTAAAATRIRDGGRLLSEANPASPSGLPSLTEPLARSGSLVLVVHATPQRVEQIAEAERVTGRYGATPLPGA